MASAIDISQRPQQIIAVYYSPLVNVMAFLGHQRMWGEIGASESILPSAGHRTAESIPAPATLHENKINQSKQISRQIITNHKFKKLKKNLQKC